jgi:hypothetical protein
MTVTVAGDQRANRIGGQHLLLQEHNNRASRDQIGVVLLRVSGNQNHPSARQGSLSRQSPSDIETTLRTQIDVEQRDVGPQLGGSLDGLITSRRHADNHHPLAFQQATGGSQEPRAVINNQTAQHHDTRIAPRLPARLPASRKLGPRRQGRPVKPRRGAGSACPLGVSLPRQSGVHHHAFWGAPGWSCLWWRRILQRFEEHERYLR